MSAKVCGASNAELFLQKERNFSRFKQTINPKTSDPSVASGSAVTAGSVTELVLSQYHLRRVNPSKILHLCLFYFPFPISLFTCGFLFLYFPGFLIKRQLGLSILPQMFFRCNTPALFCLTPFLVSPRFGSLFHLHSPTGDSTNQRQIEAENAQYLWSFNPSAASLKPVLQDSSSFTVNWTKYFLNWTVTPLPPTSTVLSTNLISCPFCW